MFNRNRRLRMMKLGRRKLRLGDIIKAKNQLVILKHVMFPIFNEMDLSRSKIRDIKIRFGDDDEFGDSSAFLDVTRNEIVVIRGATVASTIVVLAHEYGHVVTRLGTFYIFPYFEISIGTRLGTLKFVVGKRRCNILGETSAYNFQKLFIDKFNEIRGYGIKTKRGNFWKAIKSSPIHYIAGLLDFVPLGSLVRDEYK